jgi:hypothetical protein
MYRATDDQRKKLGPDFDLRKICAKFHQKILIPSVSNPGARNPPKKTLLDMAAFKNNQISFGFWKIKF